VRFAGLIDDIADVLEQMAKNMDLVVDSLRRLADLQGVDVEPGTISDPEQEETP
jgi:hypothetical protein